jgi:hypothetical protein
LTAISLLPRGIDRPSRVVRRTDTSSIRVGTGPSHPCLLARPDSPDWRDLFKNARVSAPDRPPPRPSGDTGSTFESTTDASVPDAGSAVYSPITVSGLTGSAPSDLSSADTGYINSWKPTF